MGRVYDKGVETGTLGPGRWFRWELETKQRFSAWVLDRLKCPETDDRALLGVVVQWFSDRGTRGLPGAPGASFYKAVVEPSTDEALLRWLTHGVRPTVAKLLSRHERERLALALGLS